MEHILSNNLLIAGIVLTLFGGIGVLCFRKGWIAHWDFDWKAFVETVGYENAKQISEISCWASVVIGTILICCSVF